MFNCEPFGPISWFCGFHSYVVFSSTLAPLSLISLSTLHISLCMGLIRLPMFHTSLATSLLAGRLAEHRDLQHYVGRQ